MMRRFCLLVAACAALAIPLGGGGCGDVAPNGDTDVGAWSDVLDTAGSVAPSDNVNACGGTIALVSVPGDPCGTCLDGVLVCDGVDRLRCHGAIRTPSACGTCAALPDVPGAPCGCAGTWVCNGPALRCEDPVARNACGGCSELDTTSAVGAACSDGAGITVCANPNEVVCRTAGANACGTTGALALAEGLPLGARPGDACGACGLGTVVCERGGASLTCDDSEQGRNVCESCFPLRGQPGASCGCRDTGAWACDATAEGGVACVGADPPNACGGCATLEAEPGAPCEAGAWACEGPDRVVCVPNGSGLCGGPAFLGGRPGAACGTCEDGVVVCTSIASSECVGAGERNPCGGCAALPGEIGQRCAGGRVWACDAEGGAQCVADRGTNACGGVGALAQRPGEPCGACGDGVFVCISDEDVACLGEGQANACGGCGSLSGIPGGACGVCNTGRWACDGAEAVTCAGEDPNAEFLQYADLDEDGFGDTEASALRCPGTPRFARRNGDCDDTRGDVFPGAEERCDGRDNNCDGAIDEGFIQYRDLDRDGFGDPDDARVICGDADDYVPQAGDCFDRNANVRPGQTAWFDDDRGDGSFDYNCDGVEQPALPDIGQCGIPPIGCGFEPAGQRDGWLNAPIAGCGQRETYLFNCLPTDDGCEPQVNQTLQACR